MVFWGVVVLGVVLAFEIEPDQGPPDDVGDPGARRRIDEGDPEQEAWDVQVRAGDGEIQPGNDVQKKNSKCYLFVDSPSLYYWENH